MSDFRDRQLELMKLMIKPMNIMIVTVLAYLFLNFAEQEFINLLGLKIEAYSFRKIVLYGGVFWALATFMNKYLEFGISRRRRISGDDYETERFYTEFLDKKTSEAEYKFDEISSKIEELQFGFNKMKEVSEGVKEKILSDDEKQNIISKLKNSIFDQTSDEVINEINKNISKSIPKERIDRIRRQFHETIDRLLKEVEALTRRSKVNLIIGSITAIAGVAIFVTFVLETKTAGDATNFFLTNYTPRLSLVIVVEVFAYFFLGLYKSSLTEIKYFQNEITNTEFKSLALIESIANDDEITTNSILAKFSETERNFLLKKGESTVSLEERRTTAEENNAAFNLLKDLIKRDKSRP